MLARSLSQFVRVTDGDLKDDADRGIAKTDYAACTNE